MTKFTISSKQKYSFSNRNYIDLKNLTFIARFQKSSKDFFGHLLIIVSKILRFTFKNLKFFKKL